MAAVEEGMGWEGAEEFIVGINAVTDKAAVLGQLEDLLKQEPVALYDPERQSDEDVEALYAWEQQQRILAERAEELGASAKELKAVWLRAEPTHEDRQGLFETMTEGLGELTLNEWVELRDEFGLVR